MPTACKPLRHLARNVAGTAMMEFALIMPLLIALFAGGFQLSEAITIRRKVTTTARTIADLTSSYATVTDKSLDKILNASQQVMAPYPSTGLKLTIFQVKIDANKRATVDWSRAKGMQSAPDGSTFSLPSELAIAGTWLLVARVDYTYRASFFTSLLDDIPMSETVIMGPRLSESVEKE